MIEDKDFKCIQCGECCRTLVKGRLYLSPKDEDRWVNRPDIKAWVKYNSNMDNEIWFNNETGEYPNSCPWLKENK